MRGESRLALLVLGIGLAPALIKKSKPLARYVGDHLIRAGEYLMHGTEEETVVYKSKAEAPPVVPITDEPSVEVETIAIPVEPEEVANEPARAEEPSTPWEPPVEMPSGEPTDSEHMHRDEFSPES